MQQGVPPFLCHSHQTCSLWHHPLMQSSLAAVPLCSFEPAPSHMYALPVRAYKKTLAWAWVQLPAGCVWDLEVRPQAGSAWRPLGARQELQDVCVDSLLPGTKYVFRARAGAGGSRLSSPTLQQHGRTPQLAIPGATRGLCGLLLGRRWKKVTHRERACSGSAGGPRLRL